MELSVFITFNGKLTSYTSDEEVIDELSGDIRLLQFILDISNNKDAAKAIIGNRVDRVTFYFQHKEGENFTNIKVNKGQIKQLCKYIIPSETKSVEETINEILNKQ